MEEKEEKRPLTKEEKIKSEKNPKPPPARNTKKNKPLAKKLRGKPGLARFLFHPIQVV